MRNGLIVGLDGSTPSRRALEWAGAVARARGVGLQVVTAWKYPAMAGGPLGPNVLSAPEEMERTVRERAESLVAELGDTLPADVQVHVGGGPAANVLLQAAANTVSPTIVVGARGLGGFKGLLLGSVSQQTLEYATCPVVIVREEHPPTLGADARFVVGLDGSAGAARALEWALDLTTAAGGEIIAVHAPGAGANAAVLDRARDSLQEWCRPIEAHGVPYTSRIDAGDPRDILERTAEQEDAALLVVGSRGQSAVRALRVGGVTGYLARHASRSIAVVPPTDDRGH